MLCKKGIPGFALIKVLVDTLTVWRVIQQQRPCNGYGPTGFSDLDF